MSNDPAPNSRLLSKVVKFVKNPATDWADLGRSESRQDQEQGADHASRQALKQIIERKRRNDFVRKREFDMLRKVLRSQLEKSREPEQGIPLSMTQPGRTSRDSLHQIPVRPSPSSAPAHVRADTLKKIDQIERQMARSWFKKKGGNEASDSLPSAPPDYVPSDQLASAPAPDPLPGKIDRVERQEARAWVRGKGSQGTRGVAPPVPPFMLERAPVLQTPIQLEPEPDLAPGFDATVSAEPTTMQFGSNTDFLPTQILENVPAQGQAPTLQSADAEARNQPLTEPGLVLTAENLDPELEEAAIRFANGDIEGAETSMLALLGNDGARSNHMDTWLALFDLYRAGGWQAKFDEAANDFASLFGRSAPQWSVTTGIMAPAAPAGKPDAPLAPGQAARMHWVCPASLGPQSLAALNAILRRNPSPWRMDWRGLKTIEDAALAPLLEALRRWGGAKGEYHLRDADRLLSVLVERSPTDNREVDPQWWSARLALLRLLGDMDEFDLVALNYCVTYEISPPSWEDPLARFVPIAEAGEEAEQAAPPPDVAADEDLRQTLAKAFQPTDFVPSRMLENDDLPIEGELSGVITDDVEKALQPVNASLDRAAHARAVDINCRLLLRMDFGAAGALLNWATMQQTLKRQVTLRQVNRMVGAFFGVIGIHEVARVVLRKD
ncbi:MAG: STAS domain-containing protein [Burkholderiaceae bacterium]|jgi:ABC-type transporter Mla MlaB component|nr:STAS domain-containing protein [Burkholderiaceae bacterium]